MELVVSSGAGIVVDQIARQHPVDDYRKFAGRGGNGYRLANAGRQSAIEGTERSRGAAQNDCGPVSGRPGLGTEQAPAGDLVAGCQREPGGEVLFGGPAPHVGTDLGNEL